MSRFVQPRYFDQAQSEAMESTLRQLAIGDDEGQRVFIIALEYELAEFENYSSGEAADISPPSEPVTEPSAVMTSGEFRAIAEAAAALASLLKQLTGEEQARLCEQLAASDTYSRQYGPGYLKALDIELKRLANTAQDETDEPAPDPAAPPAEKGLTDADQRLIATLAEAYAECFESDPRNQEGETFTRLLQRIMEISGLPMRPEQAQVMQVLQNTGFDYI